MGRPAELDLGQLRAGHLHAGATACPAGARCDTVTYYQPTSQIPTGYIRTNRPDFSRGYQGFEVTGRKRMSNRWSANISYAYNDAPVHYDSAAAYEDPTNIDKLNGGQFAEESTSSGLGNVFVNAKWIFRASGIYTTPLWDINVSGFYNARSGYPFIQPIQTPTRPFSAGTANVYLDVLGDNRLPNFQTVDFRIDKSFTLYKRVKIVPGDGHLQPVQRATRRCRSAARRTRATPTRSRRSWRRASSASASAPRSRLGIRPFDLAQGRPEQGRGVGFGTRDSVPESPARMQHSESERAGHRVPPFVLYASALPLRTLSWS